MQHLLLWRSGGRIYSDLAFKRSVKQLAAMLHVKVSISILFVHSNPASRALGLLAWSGERLLGSTLSPSVIDNNRLTLIIALRLAVTIVLALAEVHAFTDPHWSLRSRLVSTSASRVRHGHVSDFQFKRTIYSFLLHSVERVRAPELVFLLRVTLEQAVCRFLFILVY